MKQSRHVALQNCCTQREFRSGTDQYFFFNFSHFGKYLLFAEQRTRFSFLSPLPHLSVYLMMMNDYDNIGWLLTVVIYTYITQTSSCTHNIYILRQTHRHRGRRTHARTRSHRLLSSLPLHFQTRLVRMLSKSHGRLHSAFCLSCLLSSFTKSFSVAPRCYHFHRWACLR